MLNSRERPLYKYVTMMQDMAHGMAITQTDEGMKKSRPVNRLIAEKEIELGGSRIQSTSKVIWVPITSSSLKNITTTTSGQIFVHNEKRDI